MSTATTNYLPVPEAAMTACDRCNAEALVKVKSPASGATLAFCGHHYRQVEVDLLGWTIVKDGRPAVPVVPGK